MYISELNLKLIFWKKFIFLKKSVPFEIHIKRKCNQTGFIQVGGNNLVYIFNFLINQSWKLQESKKEDYSGVEL